MKQTTLDLNGPILSFTTNPVGVATTSSGSVTLTGIATATFPTQTPANPAVATGSISYRWYEVGVGALSDGTNIAGSATTSLTLTNLTSPTSNQRKFYLSADYIPSAYQSSTPVTVGTARSTGNAINEPINSGVGTVTVYPLLEIIGQPSNRNVLINNNTTFTVNAGLTDPLFNDGLTTYQWYLNGVAINDGTIDTSSSTTNIINDIYYYSDSANFSSDGNITLPATSYDVVVTIGGAAGAGGGSDAGGPGGGGGDARVGRFNLPGGARNLNFRIGRRGGGGGSGTSCCHGGGGSSSIAPGGRGGNTGGSGWSGGGGGGGGASGVVQDGLLLMVAAGGGGGGGGSWNVGGFGGNTYSPGISGDPYGFEATTSTINTSSGSSGADKGGDGGGGGGGGGGAFGGGGGYAGQDNGNSAAGGQGGRSKYRSDIISLNSQWQNSGDGFGSISYSYTTTTQRTEVVNIIQKTVVSGTKSPTLTMRADFVGIQTVQCRISHPSATNSPIFSNVAYFVSQSTADQYNVQLETIGISNSATISSFDLFSGDREILTSLSDPAVDGINSYYSFFAPDRDIDVEMDLYGGKGYNRGSYSGGEGGFSRIRFRMTRNTEYVIAGLSTSINAPFIYRKGQLIACVGGGGNAGASGNGGFGGGIGIAGADGFGRNGGTGGLAIAAGNMGANGVFGSLTTLAATSPDSKAAIPNGGRSIKCTKGVYWQQQGVSACSDVGTTRFRLSDGTLVTNTGSITRGYKAGYDIIQTAGKAIGTGGNGGCGATGGNGGDNNSGGGGGSGYTDGSVTVVSTTLGGSNGNARVILRLAT